MHYDTFDLIRANPAEFVRDASAKGLRAKVLAAGESLAL